MGLDPNSGCAVEDAVCLLKGAGDGDPEGDGVDESAGAAFKAVFDTSTGFAESGDRVVGGVSRALFAWVVGESDGLEIVVN